MSDLHLGDNTEALERVFFAWLDAWQQRCSALYLLGDIFEYWVGDDDLSSPSQAIAEALAAFSRTTPVFILNGNRDFLLGRQFCRRAGAVLLPDPYVIRTEAHTILLSHGDMWCTQDEKYQSFRRAIRHPLMLWGLRHLSLRMRHRLAQRLRRKSTAYKRDTASDIMDVTPSAVERAVQDYQADWVIHGHTHRPQHHVLTWGERWVLRDWRNAEGGFLLLSGHEAQAWRMQLSADQRLVCQPDEAYTLPSHEECA